MPRLLADFDTMEQEDAREHEAREQLRELESHERELGEFLDLSLEHWLDFGGEA